MPGNERGDGLVSLQTNTGELDLKRTGPAEDHRSSWRFGLRQMLYLIFYCALACWLFAVLQAPAVAVVLLFVAGVMTALAIGLARRRSSQQQMLLGIVAVALERDMPLAPALEAFADQFTRRYRRRILSLAHVLNAGVPLPEALDRVPGTLPADVELLARVGWESGTLPGAVRQAASLRGGVKAAWSAIVSRIDYFLFVLLVVQAVGGVLLLYILPRLQAIYRELGITPPAVSLMVFGWGHWLDRNSEILLWLFPLELLVMMSLLATLYGWSRFNISLVDRLFQRRHSALVFRSLAWIIEGGVPLPRGCLLLSRWYPTEWVKVLLLRVSEDVRHGTDWIESLSYHGLLGRSDAAILDSARRVGNLPWALREAAESVERRLVYRLQAIAHLLLPLVVLSLGSVIGLLGIAYLLPLIMVLERLSQ